MRRLGFRRVLPLIFTGIHLVLIWSPLARKPYASTEFSRDLAYRSVAYQERRGVPIQMTEPPPLKTIEKIALVLDLPAMYFGTLITAALFPRNDMASMYTSIVFVPFVWYGVGRWLDGLFGYTQRLRMPRILRGVFSILAVGVLCVSVAGMTPVYHHRTTDTGWIFTGLILWSGLCLVIVTSSPDQRNRS